MDVNHPAVFCIPFPADKTIPFQVVNYSGDIADALEYFAANLALGQ